jgi:hypothetical protein
MIFVFDTSSFLQMNSYYPDVFPGFWQQFDQAVTDGTAISTREVFRELDRQEPDHILTWAKQNPTLFRTPTSDETKFVVEILAVPHFQQLIGAQAQLVGTPVADPFVIALAAVNKGAVVTEERFKPNAAKIPNVCQHFGIESLNLEKFLRAAGWKF